MRITADSSSKNNASEKTMEGFDRDGVPVASSQSFLGRNWQTDSNIYVKSEESRIDEPAFKRGKKIENLTLPDFKIYNTAIIKSLWYWYKDIGMCPVGMYVCV